MFAVVESKTYINPAESFTNLTHVIYPLWPLKTTQTQVAIRNICTIPQIFIIYITKLVKMFDRRNISNDIPFRSNRR